MVKPWYVGLMKNTGSVRTRRLGYHNKARVNASDNKVCEGNEGRTHIAIVNNMGMVCAETRWG